MSDEGLPQDALSRVQCQDEQERQDLAERVGRYLHAGGSEADRRAALEISRVLASDASEAVRKALVMELRHSAFLPADLVDRVISDLDSIAAPFVRKSTALDEERLIRLVKLGCDALHLAVADRDHVSEPVSYALCEVAKQPALTRLMENEGAVVSKRAYFMVVDRFPEAETLMEVMCHRGDLPIEAAETLLERLTDSCANFLVKRFDLAPDFASYLAESARRRVMGQTLETAPIAALERYMAQLKADGELGADILLHLVRNGNVRSFLAGVAVLTDESTKAVQTQLAEQGQNRLMHLLDQCGFGNSTIAMMMSAYRNASLAFSD